MRSLIFGDLHFGLSDGHSFYLDLNKKVLDRIKLGVDVERVDQIVFLGDLFHYTDYIDMKSLNQCRTFLDELDALNLRVYFILGNHDIFARKVKNVNAYNIFKGFYKNINFVCDIVENGDNVFVGFCQNKEELDEYERVVEEHRKTHKNTFVFGHFEFLDGGVPNPHAYENKFKNLFIFSGHYHERSVNNHQIYVGSPYPHTWNGKNREDYGYCIFDDATQQVSFVDMNLFAFREWTLSRLTETMLADGEYFHKKITGNEIRIKCTEAIEPEKLVELKSTLSSYKPKNLSIDTMIEFSKEDEAKYEHLVLNSPKEFILDYIKDMTLPKDQKKRILEKISPQL